MKYKIFDLDGTLFKTPSIAASGLLEGGVPDFMLPLNDNANDWWTDPISFDERMPIPGLKEVHDAALEAIKDKNTYSILITHRVPKMEDVIRRLLKRYKLGFDLVIICNPKIPKPEILMRKHPDFKNAEHVEVYEDSIKQILSYRELFMKLNIPYTFKLISLTHMVTIEKLEVSDMVDVHEIFV